MYTNPIPKYSLIDSSTQCTMQSAWEREQLRMTDIPKRDQRNGAPRILHFKEADIGFRAFLC